MFARWGLFVYRVRWPMLAALAPLARDPLVSGIETPYGGKANASALISHDGRRALAIVSVFGSAVAAVLPLGVAALALVAGPAGVYLLGLITDITQYALNLVALIGLGVAIDYSLFIVNRFGEELTTGGGGAPSGARRHPLSSGGLTGISSMGPQ